MIEIVSASQRSTIAFKTTSALASSLRRLSFDAEITASITVDNRDPLASVYNPRIVEGGADDIVVFMHDDVWINDFYFSTRIAEGLERFDIIGIAGNRRRQQRQTAWFASPVTGEFDTEYLSGAIGHGRDPLAEVSRYGPAPAACELLDGVLLAAKRSTLRRTGLRFDAQFDFHFYDLDFCRSAKAKGLTLGTWPIALTHQSVGAFKSPSWMRNAAAYLKKWPD